MDAAPLRHLAHLALLVAALLWGGAPQAAAQEPYRIAPGDSVSFSVFGQPELSGVRRVGEDGAVALHLVGPVAVEGLTVAEAAQAVAAALEKAFKAPASVVAEMAAWRDIFVLGEVERPGAYTFAPGLTVVKALALAGDVRRLTPVGDEGSRRVLDERRRLLSADMQMAEAEATIAEIDAEIARIDAAFTATAAGSASEALPEALTETAPDAAPEADPEADAEDGAGAAEAAPALPLSPPPESGAEDGGSERARLQALLIEARRSVLERAVDGAVRQRALALEEAELLRQRGEFVANQLAATERNLADVDSLVARGLARRDRQLDLMVDADAYRANALEVAAFEARARQAALNAESGAAVSIGRYREALIANRLEAVQALEAANIDYSTSLEFLRAYGDAATLPPGLAPPEPVYEIIRAGETLAADETTPLRPADVLRVTLAPAPAP